VRRTEFTRRLSVLWLLWYPLAVFAQANPESSRLEGVLLESVSGANSGRSSIRGADDRVTQFEFGPGTIVRRDHESIRPYELHPGERVEIVFAAQKGISIPVAEIVQVVSTSAEALPAPERCGGKGIEPNRLLSFDYFAPYNLITMTGVFVRCNGDRLLLHTRDHAEKTVLLNARTQYVEDGEIVGPDHLKKNQRVFVRGTRGWSDDIEAYQILWGDILRPR